MMPGRRSCPLAAAAALEKAHAHLKATIGESYGFKRMTELMGFPEVRDVETRWAQPGPARAAE